MWYLFYLENIHFSLNVFAALVLFAVGWLYLDAWQLKKSSMLGSRVIGFFLLAISYLIHAANVESSLMPVSFFPESLQDLLITLIAIPGYAMIVVSLFLEPIQHTDAGFGPGRSGEVQVIGTLLGVVIDARGRPLQLSKEAGYRREMLKKWIWTLGG